MKRLLLLCGLALLVAPAAFATATSTYTGVSGGNNKPFAVYVTTLRDGDLTVRADFAATGRTDYVLRVWRTTHIVGVRDFCDAGVGDDLRTSPLSCTVTNAPAGQYYVDFRAINGKTAVTLTVTGETDPQ